MTSLHRSLAVLAVCTLLPAAAAFAQQHGMPPEARAAIHALLDNHAGFERTVTHTETGYVAVTETDDAELAAVLRDHVAQMGARLDDGLMVRRWDPAFAEYVRHYDRLSHEFVATERGVRMVVTGATPEAIAVARNHAEVIVDFVEHGWAAHDRTHAAVAAGTDAAEADGPGCGKGRRAGRGGETARGAGHGGGGCCGGCGAGS